jgi:hypothetical protein
VPGFDLSFVSNPWLPASLHNANVYCNANWGWAARLRLMRLELLNNQEEIHAELAHLSCSRAPQV